MTMSFINLAIQSSSSLLLCARTASANLLRRPVTALAQQQQQLFSMCGSGMGNTMTLFIARWKHTLKTNKSVSKRFRARGGGAGHKRTTLTHMRSGAQHNTGYRSRASINKLGQSKSVSNKKVEKKMKICMGLL